MTGSISKGARAATEMSGLAMAERYFTVSVRFKYMIHLTPRGIILHFFVWIDCLQCILTQFHMCISTLDMWLNSPEDADFGHCKAVVESQRRPRHFFSVPCARYTYVMLLVSLCGSHDISTFQRQATKISAQTRPQSFRHSAKRRMLSHDKP